jgi:hypothetical protein
MSVRPVLHGDSPEGTTVLAMLHLALWLFRAAKYRPEFPIKGFVDVEAARKWGDGLRAIVQPRTPAQRHPLRPPGAASCRAGWPRHISPTI